MSDAPPGIGHNDPPPYDIEQYQAFKARITDFNETLREWLSREKLLDEDEAEKLNDFISGARALRSDIEDARKVAKSVWDAKVKAVQDDWRLLTTQIEAIEKAPGGLLAEWLRKKAAEQAQKRLERLAELEEEREATTRQLKEANARDDTAAVVAARERLKEIEREEKRLGKKPRVAAGSASGGAKRRGLRKVRVGVIVNKMRVLMHYREHPAIEETLQRLVNADIRAVDVDATKIPGIEIEEKDELA